MLYFLNKVLGKKLDDCLDKNTKESKPQLLTCTVKASNFVILLDENIFFLQISLRAPHDFFGIEICVAEA